VNILLDHCLPKRLKHSFPEHAVATARAAGWEGLKNGKLLQEAAQRFDGILTVDQNIKHQQNLARLPMAILVIVAPDNRLPTLLQYVPAVKTALAQLLPRTLVEVAS
jgi:predicted nuclease of predicted toxin-antitoxin system